MTTTPDTHLPDGDYTLTEGAAWFTVKGLSVWIRHTGDGVAVDIFQDGREAEYPLACAFVPNSELEETP